MEVHLVLLLSFETLVVSVGGRHPRPSILASTRVERSLLLSSMSCGCLVIQEVEDGEEAKSKTRASSSCSSSSSHWWSRRCRSENMFPIYAMGNSKLNSIARTVLDSGGDLIWDSVRAEAKSEVVVFPPLLLFLNLFRTEISVVVYV